MEKRMTPQSAIEAIEAVVHRVKSTVWGRDVSEFDVIEALENTIADIRSTFITIPALKEQEDADLADIMENGSYLEREFAHYGDRSNATERVAS